VVVPLTGAKVAAVCDGAVEAVYVGPAWGTSARLPTVSKPVVHRAFRVLAVVLLLSAAVDLLLPSCCVDGGDVTAERATFCSTTHQTEPGHPGDDCFCCSRTVRTEPVLAVSFVVTVSPVAAATTSALPDCPARPSYHPPQA
jgi:hypothetical protein